MSLTWENIKQSVNNTPHVVLSVIGDTESFVPHSWPRTVFQTALIEAAKSGLGKFYQYNTERKRKEKN